MASEELTRFLSEYLPRHPEVKAQLDALAGEHLLEAAVAAAAKADCAFPKDELREALEAGAARRSGAELSEEQLESVAGGKAGGGPQKYMVFKLADVLISSVNPGGASDPGPFPLE